MLKDSILIALDKDDVVLLKNNIIEGNNAIKEYISILES